MDANVRKTVLSQEVTEGTKEAEFFNYLLLVWKEGMSLEAVVEKGEFPKQVTVDITVE